MEDKELREVATMPVRVVDCPLSNEGRLVKSWRLGKANELSCELSAGGEVIVVGMYLDPASGHFYARLPEIPDGALFFDEKLKDLRKRLVEALREHVDQWLPPDTRTWKRVIRMAYPEAMASIPDWRSGEGRRTRVYLSWNVPGFCLGENKDMAWTVRKSGSHVVGPLTFTRIECANRPDGRIDVREWEEDYQARLEVWEARLTPSEHREKPRRFQVTEHSHGSSRFSLFAQRGLSRELPWSQETWDALLNFRRHFQATDAAVRRFLSESDDETLQLQLMVTRSMTSLLTDTSQEEGR